MNHKLIFATRTITLQHLRDNEEIGPHYIHVHLHDGSVITDIDDYEIIEANHGLYSEKADNPEMMVLDIITDYDRVEETYEHKQVPLKDIRIINYYDKDPNKEMPY